MPKIRTVKPELFRHEKLFEAELQFQLPLRLVFIGLLTCCDRRGRFRWRPRQLKLDILPYDEIDFVKVLDALHAAQLIGKYEKDGEYYGYIPSWEKHQSINPREPESQLPDPKICLHLHSTALPMQAPASALTENASDNALGIPVITENSSVNSFDDSEICGVCDELQNNALHMQAPAEHLPLPEAQMLAPLEVEMERDMEMEQELEGKGCGEGKPKSAVKSPPREKPDVLEIFEHWKITMHQPQAMLDKKRRSLIRKALQAGYSSTQLCEAITGCSLTPHNMGDNEHGQRFDGLHIILRDADQIDRFIKNYRSPPRPPDPAEKLQRNNIVVAQTWLANQTNAGDPHEKY